MRTTALKDHCAFHNNCLEVVICNSRESALCFQFLLFYECWISPHSLPLILNLVTAKWCGSCFMALRTGGLAKDTPVLGWDKGKYMETLCQLMQRELVTEKKWLGLFKRKKIKMKRVKWKKIQKN